jgi:hypothetical protein
MYCNHQVHRDFLITLYNANISNFTYTVVKHKIAAIYVTMWEVCCVVVTYFCSELFYVILFTVCVVTRRQSPNVNVIDLEEICPCAYKDLLGKPEGTTPCGRPRRSKLYNIQMDLIDVEWRTWTGLTWLMLGRNGGFL